MDLNEAVEKLVEEIIENRLEPKTLLRKDDPKSEDFADEFDNRLLTYIDGLEEDGEDHEDGNAFSRGVLAALRTKKGKELLAAAVKTAVEEILHRPPISTVPTSPINFTGILADTLLEKREMDAPKTWKPTLLWTTGPHFCDAKEILNHCRNGELFYRIAREWTDPRNAGKKKYTLMYEFNYNFQKFEFFDTLEAAQARAEELDAASSPPVKQEEPPKEEPKPLVESPPCALKELPPKKLVLWVDEMDPAHQHAFGHRQAGFVVFLTSGCGKYRVLQTDWGFYKTPSLLHHRKEDGIYHCKNSFPTVAEAQEAAEKMEQEEGA